MAEKRSPSIQSFFTARDQGRGAARQLQLKPLNKQVLCRMMVMITTSYIIHNGQYKPHHIVYFYNVFCRHSLKHEHEMFCHQQIGLSLKVELLPTRTFDFQKDKILLFIVKPDISLLYVCPQEHELLLFVNPDIF